MKRNPLLRPAARTMTCIALSLSIALPLPALSASVSLATTPLATATNTTVLPNLMFVLDSSGSMGWNYLPDWANDNLCKNTTGAYDKACVNQPPFQSPDFNGVYYNPEIRYVPAVNFDGTSKPSQTTWTSVKNDAYGVQSTGSTNLVTGYVDVEWCTDTSYTDCLRNDNYILPGVVNGKTYSRMHTTTSNGSGSVATGMTNSPMTLSRTWGPHYYRIIPAEYCDSSKLTNCQSTQGGNFNYPAKVRWCNTEANATAATPAAGSCQGLRTSSFTYARYPTKFPSSAGNAGSPAVPASATFDVNVSCTDVKTVKVGSVNVGNTNIISSATTSTSYSSTLATSIRDQINNGGSGYTASVASSNKITITAPVSAGNLTAGVTLGNFTYSGKKGTCSVSIDPANASFSNYRAAIPASDYPGFVRTDIVPGNTYPRSAGRSDCTTSTSYCTYDEEMTNFANWWTYYQTRMQSMKTAASRSFKPIDNRYRVGFIDIWGNNYLPIAKFDAGTGNAKDLWYQKLFSMNPANGTPLRSALARVGLIFAGKKPVGSDDPVQYSCQQNFTLLTTDGYWNTDNYNSSTNSYYPTTGNNGSDIKKIDGTNIGDQDGGTTARPMYEGPTATYNTLADVAKYYYDTDLRNAAFGNCTGALGTDVCEDNVFKSDTDNKKTQHMTTFTLGLGVDGTLNYTSDYKTATSGDYSNLAKGTGSPVVNWPVPSADSETAVDDLWHAAVNGAGTYFSAKDPAQLTSGLNGALSALNSKVGAGAAAATSTLNPVAGDNYAFVASYTTVKWKGNLESRTIDTNTGAVSRTATWCVENVVAETCTSPSTFVTDTSGGSTAYYCVTPNSTADTCSGTLDGTNCKVQQPVACTGTMASKVAPAADTRRIYMSNGSSLVDFTYNNLSDAQKAYFTGTSLSQWADLDATQKSNVPGNLVNFLRGQTGYEDRTSNVTINGAQVTDNRLFRYREATLGDALESQPAFVGQPYFNYTDTGYSDFKAAKINRPKTVYIGTNDGMLHAFDASNGTERWAYVPSMVIPNMWKLADKNYATMHTNYVNGRPIIGDVYDSATSSWHTILVGGLNGGGRGYYALDITDPTTPTLLWEIDSNTEPNLGYSFGYPVITKKSDGTWVVLLSSGYNNTNPGDGQGYLYVRNALTGAHISRIATGIGDPTTPSGLGRIANWGDDPDKNNMSVYAYAGDLLGNLWRFDINSETKSKFAVLKDSTGASARTQPITTRPELGRIKGKRVVFVGTGKYLELSDLENTQTQTIYAIKDDDATTTLDNPRLNLVQQTISAPTADGTRTASSNAVDFTTGLGWYADLPDSRERVHVDPVLDSALLIVPSTVTSNAVCSPGGYGWLNYFDYRTGTNITGVVSQKYDAPIVGINVIYTNGGRVVSAVRADDPTPDPPPVPPPQTEGSTGFVGKRVIWRELIQ
ncbi:pilus assembly protein [Noviherbaspirillum autotrophicum]|uniref:pilus assembly protein n=1 Tax=Noviherbaspirillum autotrophicum TaxID=709839 RepID=UPI00058961F9|nr:PilC/PilY family type IV pilus protein [Noviherbaspirillum autotrophicum]